MKTILDNKNQYKSIISSLESSNAFELANSQRKLINNISGKSGINELLKQHAKIESLIGIDKFSDISKYQHIFNNTAFDTLSKTQLLSSSAVRLSTITSQHKGLLQKIDSSLLKKLENQQAIFQNSLFSKSTIEHFSNESLRINKLINNQSWMKLVDSNHFLNSSFIKSFQNSTRILSDLNSVSSLFKNLEKNKFQNLTEESFSLKLFNELKTENLDFHEAIEIVEEAFTNKIETCEKSWVSFEGIIQLLFAFTLYIISQVSASNAEEQYLEKLDNIETSLIEKINSLVPNKIESENTTHYVVKRIAKLYSGSSTDSHILDLLYPNQRVKLIKRNGKWIYIEYFDNLNGIPKMGWVYKKHLKMDKINTSFIVTNEPKNWDDEIKEDIDSGKLDDLANMALAELKIHVLRTWF